MQMILRRPSNLPHITFWYVYCYPSLGTESKGIIESGDAVPLVQRRPYVRIQYVPNWLCDSASRQSSLDHVAILRRLIMYLGIYRKPYSLPRNIMTCIFRLMSVVIDRVNAPAAFTLDLSQSTNTVLRLAQRA